MGLSETGTKHGKREKRQNPMVWKIIFFQITGDQAHQNAIFLA